MKMVESEVDETGEYKPTYAEAYLCWFRVALLSTFYTPRRHRS